MDIRTMMIRNIKTMFQWKIDMTISLVRPLLLLLCLSAALVTCDNDPKVTEEPTLATEMPTPTRTPVSLLPTPTPPATGPLPRLPPHDLPGSQPLLESPDLALLFLLDVSVSMNSCPSAVRNALSEIPSFIFNYVGEYYGSTYDGKSLMISWETFPKYEDSAQQSEPTLYTPDWFQRQGWQRLLREDLQLESPSRVAALDFSDALNDAVRMLKLASFDQEQKAIIVITDGVLRYDPLQERLLSQDTEAIGNERQALKEWAASLEETPNLSVHVVQLDCLELDEVWTEINGMTEIRDQFNLIARVGHSASALKELFEGDEPVLQPLLPRWNNWGWLEPSSISIKLDPIHGAAEAVSIAAVTIDESHIDVKIDNASQSWSGSGIQRWDNEYEVDKDGCEGRELELDVSRVSENYLGLYWIEEKYPQIRLEPIKPDVPLNNEVYYDIEVLVKGRTYRSCYQATLYVPHQSAAENGLYDVIPTTSSTNPLTWRHVAFTPTRYGLDTQNLIVTLERIDPDGEQPTIVAWSAITLTTKFSPMFLLAESVMAMESCCTVSLVYDYATADFYPSGRPITPELYLLSPLTRADQEHEQRCPDLLLAKERAELKAMNRKSNDEYSVFELTENEDATLGWTESEPQITMTGRRVLVVKLHAQGLTETCGYEKLLIVWSDGLEGDTVECFIEEGICGTSDDVRIIKQTESGE